MEPTSAEVDSISVVVNYTRGYTGVSVEHSMPLMLRTVISFPIPVQLSCLVQDNLISHPTRGLTYAMLPHTRSIYIKRTAYR
jgi:hypothetical protein